MPSIVDHKGKYESNKSFLDSINEKEKYADWTVTVIFYCCVHLIEKMLCHKLKIHSANHTDRFEKIKKLPNYLEFRDEYSELYQLCHAARYTCIAIRENDLFDADVDFHHIEQFEKTCCAS